MSHQAPTVTQSLSGKLRILDHKYLRTVEPWLPVAVWGLPLAILLSVCAFLRFLHANLRDIQVC
jgi:ABC-type transport system involved in cytochrome bd biosynthesis fused ATPase/permease subunit